MKRMCCQKRPRRILWAAAMFLLAAPSQIVSAATAPSLGTAASFAVLAGSTVTNTGPTVINRKFRRISGRVSHGLPSWGGRPSRNDPC